MTNATSMSLGDRMKNYENVNRNKLIRRTPVIIRIDGKAFHTWTKGLQRPFDNDLTRSMANTMRYLVDNIQGAVFGYTQSDEISIFLRDYDRVVTEAWFDNNIQKMVSIAASMTTAYFNSVQFWEHWKNAGRNCALFDARIFNLPKEEVANYFIWRQQDATRNSVQMLGQHELGHKKMQGLSNSKVQDALMELTPSINWNDYPTSFKRGVAYSKSTNGEEGEIDFDMPIITADKDYVNKHVYIKETA